MVGMPDHDVLPAVQAHQAAFARQNSTTVDLSGIDLIDGVLWGTAWSGSSIAYAFPDSADDFGYTGEPDDPVTAVSTKIEQAAQYLLDTSFGNAANNGFSVEGFTDLKVSEGTDTESAIRYAQYDSTARPAHVAGFPGETEAAGDVWFSTILDYSNAVQGNFKFSTVAHETGHALGLRHGHAENILNGVTYPALSAEYDSQEYSLMTYRSYVGQPTFGPAIEEFGYPQTYMMADIAALQYLYGANFSVNSGNTVYKWNPDSGNTWVNGKVGISNEGNVIFATIWDGGGAHDKYDLSAYASNLEIDLRAGKYSVFSDDQLSDLDWFNTPGVHIARGSIFNALQYHGDKRSLIEDVTGGSGNDMLTGNQASNRLIGNGGRDTFIGLKGNDTLTGNSGRDIFNFSAGGDGDKITDFQAGRDTIDLESFDFNRFSNVKSLATDAKNGVTIDFGHGDSLLLLGMHRSELHAGDFQI